MKTFNTAPTTRGAVFATLSGFEISGQPMPRFGEINSTYPGIFTTFSPPRLFTPLGSTITDVHFYVPGETTPAVVNAFGAVFTDVDLPQSTSIEYFDAAGSSLGRAFVPPANNGLSFVGFVFQDKRIGRVRITSGNASLGARLQRMAALSTSSLWTTSFTVNHPSTRRRSLPIHSIPQRIRSLPIHSIRQLRRLRIRSIPRREFGVCLTLREGSENPLEQSNTMKMSASGNQSRGVMFSTASCDDMTE